MPRLTEGWQPSDWLLLLMILDVGVAMACGLALLIKMIL